MAVGCTPPLPAVNAYRARVLEGGNAVRSEYRARVLEGETRLARSPRMKKRCAPICRCQRTSRAWAASRILSRRHSSLLRDARSALVAAGPDAAAAGAGAAVAVPSSSAPPGPLRGGESRTRTR